MNMRGRGEGERVREVSQRVSGGEGERVKERKKERDKANERVGSERM